jgi:hypothetical protein
MAIRFHLDENVSRGVASALRRRGIDVTTAVDATLIGADDVDQLRFAIAQQRVVVTHDDDFTRIHAEGIEHAGICYCHEDKHSIGELMRLLLLVNECCDERQMRGNLEYL